MREKLNSKHGRGANDNQWTLMMEGVSHPFHQENPQMGFSLRPFNFGVLSPPKGPFRLLSIWVLASRYWERVQNLTIQYAAFKKTPALGHASVFGSMAYLPP